MPRLILRDVAKRYATRNIQTTALDVQLLEVEDGEFISISGPSGCGKSTLLNILGLLDRFDEGSYTLNGNETGALSEWQRSRIRAKFCSYVFQSHNLIDSITAIRNVILRPTLLSRPSPHLIQRAELILSRLGLEARAHHYPPQLSGGQQQRVAIARAIFAGRPLLLADEPTGNLDAAATALTLDLIQELHREGTTVILVTHDPAVAALAGRRLRMAEGRIVGEDRGELA